MDYESRRVKWYWLFLFIAWSVGACYVLFAGNPYLYSQQDLRSALMAYSDTQLQTIPSEPKPAAVAPGTATYFDRYNFARTGVDPEASVRSKGFEEFERHEIKTGIEGFKPRHFAADATGFYVTDEAGWITAIGLDGRSRWRFHFLTPPGDKGLWPPLIDQAHTYVIHPSGEVVAFDKTSGEIRWLLPLTAELVANPFLWGNVIVLPTKGPQGVYFTLVNRASGKKLEDSAKIDIKPGFLVSHAPGADAIIATVENKVIALNPENWTVLWRQTLTDPVRGPAMLLENDIFVATLGAKLVKLSADRKGRTDWEIELENPAAAPPTYIPNVGRLSFVDAAGGLTTIDPKTGKIFWRYGIEAQGARVMDTWSAKISMKFINETGMDWAHKGWTIWSGCGERRICFYTPLKGQLINRLALSGEPLTQPLLLDQRLVFFTESKPGTYVLSHLVGDAEIRRIRTEARATTN